MLDLTRRLSFCINVLYIQFTTSGRRVLTRCARRSRERDSAQVIHSSVSNRWVRKAKSQQSSNAIIIPQQRSRVHTQAFSGRPRSSLRVQNAVNVARGICFYGRIRTEEAQSKVRDIGLSQSGSTAVVHRDGTMNWGDACERFMKSFFRRV